MDGNKEQEYFRCFCLSVIFGYADKIYVEKRDQKDVDDYGYFGISRSALYYISSYRGKNQWISV